MGFLGDFGSAFKTGFETISGGVTEHLTGGPPQKAYLGGSAFNAEGERNKLQSRGKGAMFDGRNDYGGGVQTLGSAANSAVADRGNAGAYSTGGMMLGQSSIDQQNQALARQNDVTGQMLATAGQQGPSAAQAQMQMGLDQSQRAMMAQAAAARGGNQAAAMRTAQATGANMANDVNQQAGVLRAQEAQQQQMNMMGAQQAAAGIYGGQQQTMGNTAQLGYGMQGQGLGLAQGSTGQLAGIGANQTSAALGQQNIGLGYDQIIADRDKAQLEADRGNASASAAAKSPAAAFGSVLGGVTQLWGGGGK